jgi:hypothetical protein
LFLALVGCASMSEFLKWREKKKREIEWLFMAAHGLVTSYREVKASGIRPIDLSKRKRKKRAALAPSSVRRENSKLRRLEK